MSFRNYLGAGGYYTPSMTRQEIAEEKIKDIFSKIEKLINYNLTQEHVLEVYENQIMRSFTDMYDHVRTDISSSTVDPNDRVDMTEVFNTVIHERENSAVTDEFQVRFFVKIMATLADTVLEDEIFEDLESDLISCLTYWSRVYVREYTQNLSALFDILDGVLRFFKNASEMGQDFFLEFMIGIYNGINDRDHIEKLCIFHVMRWHNFSINTDENTSADDDEYDTFTEGFVEKLKIEMGKDISKIDVLDKIPSKFMGEFHSSVRLLYIMYEDVEPLVFVLSEALKDESDMMAISEQNVIKPILAVLLENCLPEKVDILDSDMLKQAIEEIFRGQYPPEVLILIMRVFHSRSLVLKEENKKLFDEVVALLSQTITRENLETLKECYTLTTPKIQMIRLDFRE